MAQILRRKMKTNFAKNLKIFRSWAGISQKKLAEKSQINYRHFQNIESGRSDVKLSTSENLAENLNIPLCYLYQEHPPKEFLNSDLFCPAELIDLLPVGVIVVNFQGQLIYTNNFFRTHLTNYSPSDLLQNSIYIWDNLYGSASEKEKAKERFFYFAQNKPPLTTAHWTYSGPNQKPINVLVHWNYIKGSKNEPKSFIATIIPNQI